MAAGLNGFERPVTSARRPNFGRISKIVKPDTNKSVTLNQTQENNLEVFKIIGFIKRIQCVRYCQGIPYERKLKFNLFLSVRYMSQFDTEYR